MIRRIFLKTNGECIGFSDARSQRYKIDAVYESQLKRLAGDANRHSTLIDRESAFDGEDALTVIRIESAGEGGRAIIDGQPSAFVLSRVELATLAEAMGNR